MFDGSPILSEKDLVHSSSTQRGQDEGLEPWSYIRDFLSTAPYYICDKQRISNHGECFLGMAKKE